MPRVDKHNLLRGGILVLRISSLRSTGGGMCRGGGSGGDGNTAGVVHLARHSPAEGASSPDESSSSSSPSSPPSMG
uniref:Uncharacterized protein n=1 Tax=Tanacetum cinerariifolium TaxID=118510 RepID=A0A699R8L6_TANCI|nr:hypothetical protein [Tanacetum cinerariifolium]